ncbi:hypothetical protein PSCICJ_13910 [Pseudomonas cichorii]|uniref:Uncharacterized protein n=1 Tax=Pseudomonas cichorii TaxID=36746 RepID=A0ABQ1DHV7_PSECI|nr:hypothetical protein PSCICJ_13910 [Pseudomonas cichorii]GFM90462.1 hypothetical protein PSCICP_04340 [Pseudomonas cichorii]
MLCLGLQAEVYRVDTHQRLTLPDALAGIDQALKHLARDTKTQIALNPRRNGAGKGTRNIR